MKREKLCSVSSSLIRAFSYMMTSSLTGLPVVGFLPVLFARTVPAKQRSGPDSQLNDGDLTQILIIQSVLRIEKQKDPDIHHQVQHREQRGDAQEDEGPASCPGFVENQQKQLGKDNREGGEKNGIWKKEKW
ncbi:hypothetical protein [Faecalibaculum rodentium]|uniref:hypothetical protein n=1 Tax=Faecalibaculum rodentium TaxID=1702221 RepID=UPI001F57AD06|nr:hypothetical protein [Faecalibaculum rodentium]